MVGRRQVKGILFAHYTITMEDSFCLFEINLYIPINIFSNAGMFPGLDQY